MFRSSLVAKVGLKRALMEKGNNHLKVTIYGEHHNFHLTFLFSSTVFESAALCYNQHNSVYVLHEL